jgi:tyrosinase
VTSLSFYWKSDALTRSPRLALNTSFTVFVFIGDFPTDHSLWPTAVNLVLPAHAFVSHNAARVAPYSGQGDNPNREPPQTDGSNEPPRPPPCANCERQRVEGRMSRDWVPLTHFLMHYILTGRRASAQGSREETTLQSLDQAAVIPFLKRHLHWRVLRSDNVEIHPNDVPGFQVWVHDEVMVLPKRMHEFPTYKDHALQWEITHGRPGGLGHGEWP